MNDSLGNTNTCTYKNLSVQKRVCTYPFSLCKYYNQTLDLILHCIKDSNIGVCLTEYPEYQQCEVMNHNK